MTEWEKLEYQCSLLYAVLLNSDNQGAADGYGMIAAFSGRIELLTAAANAFRFIRLPGFRPMRGTIREIGNFNPRRNEIAHGVAQRYRGKHEGYYLVPAAYATKKRAAPLGKYAYTSSQIRDYASHFSRLSKLVEHWQGEVLDSWFVKYEGWPRPVTRWHSDATR